MDVPSSEICIIWAEKRGFYNSTTICTYNASKLSMTSLWYDETLESHVASLRPRSCNCLSTFRSTLWPMTNLNRIQRVRDKYLPMERCATDVAVTLTLLAVSCFCSPYKTHDGVADWDIDTHRPPPTQSPMLLMLSMREEGTEVNLRRLTRNQRANVPCSNALMPRGTDTIPEAMSPLCGANYDRCKSSEHVLSGSGATDVFLSAATGVWVARSDVADVTYPLKLGLILTAPSCTPGKVTGLRGDPTRHYVCKDETHGEACLVRFYYRSSSMVASERRTLHCIRPVRSLSEAFLIRFGSYFVMAAVVDRRVVSFHTHSPYQSFWGPRLKCDGVRSAEAVGRHHLFLRCVGGMVLLYDVSRNEVARHWSQHTFSCGDGVHILRRFGLVMVLLSVDTSMEVVGYARVPPSPTRLVCVSSPSSTTPEGGKSGDVYALASYKDGDTAIVHFDRHTGIASLPPGLHMSTIEGVHGAGGILACKGTVTGLMVLGEAFLGAECLPYTCAHTPPRDSVAMLVVKGV